MEGVGFVNGGLLVGPRSREVNPRCCRVRMTATGKSLDGNQEKKFSQENPIAGWKTGLVAVVGVAMGMLGNPMASKAGIFGQSKLKLNESEKVTSGMTTVAAGVGFVYLAYRRNRAEDSNEAQIIKDEAERLEKWKQEFEESENDDVDSVSNEDLMASLRTRLQKKETAGPASTEDVERLNRLFQNSDPDAPPKEDEETGSPKPPAPES